MSRNDVDGKKSIVISHHKEQWSLPVNNGLLSYDTLIKTFPTATGLYYLEDNPDGSKVNRIVNFVENNNLKIENFSVIYYLHIPKGIYQVPNI